MNARRFATIAVSLVLTLSTSVAHASAPAYLWSSRMGGAVTDNVMSVAVDAGGNIYITGQFEGTLNLGGAPLTSAGDFDIFLAKYHANGVHQWSQRCGSTSAEAGLGITIDPFGKLIMTGFFMGTVDFGGVQLISLLGTPDIFVARFDTNTGFAQWAQRFGSSSGGDWGYAVDTDGSGSVFLTGYFTGTADFPGGGFTTVGGQDGFLIKFDSNGVYQWKKRFGTGNSDAGKSIAVDASGSVIATGYFSGTMNLGGSNLVTAGAQDMFLVKYDSGGTHQWSQRFGGAAANDVANSVAVDASGSVFLTGTFVGTVNFGGSNLVANQQDLVLAKYNTAGTHQWSQRFGGNSLDVGNSVSVDAAGNVYLTGGFGETVNFGGTALTTHGGFDIFLARYETNGTHTWSQGFGGVDSDNAFSAVPDAHGTVVTVGYAYGVQPVDFGGGSMPGAGDTDVILLKVSSGFAEPDISSITDIGNDQGRKVKIRFSRSGGDAATAANPVTRYLAFRRDAPPPAASSAHVIGGRALDSGWTQVGSVDAFATGDYGIDVPTIGDSTIVLGQYHSTFFVRAATDLPATYYDSPIDSGYSLDNLSPGIPDNLIYTAGDLEWDESSAADFDYFTVYGSNTDSFGSAVLVNYTVAPTMDVTASPYVFYFVTATDFSGNEGKPSRVNTLSGVGGTPKSYVLSVSNYPNPFNPRTTVSYTVPAGGAVRVAIYDLRGAHVATLFEGERAAGPYSIEWDGRSAVGEPVSSGVYFARIEHNGATRSKKMMLLK